MKRVLIICFMAALFFNSKLTAGDILINKAGYLPKAVKYTYFTTAVDSFYVIDVRDKIVLRGKAELSRSNDPATGKTIYRGNFSSVTQPGFYFVIDKSGSRSPMVYIADTVFNSVYKKSLKGFYFQRCGTQLFAEHAGVYQHGSCHSLRPPFYSGDGTFHKSITDTTGQSNVIGGWHDAGDYGKYVVNAGISVGTLLMAYEMFPEKFSNDDLKIPETGNKVPDILDECRYELDWLFKMQRPNGAVFTKVTHESFEGFIMPQNDNTTRYIYQVSSTATADFAGMMARAYRVFKKFDAAYSEKCLTAAKKAWSYLEANPSIFPSGGFKNPSGTSTGEYGDSNDQDERLWAAAELFISTNESKYHTFYLNNYKKSGPFWSAMGWPTMGPMAQLTYIFGNSSLKDATALADHKTALNNLCGQYLARTKNDGFNVVQSTDYYWGSNGDILNKAILLIAGYELNKTQDYYDAALSQLNYILGTNIHNISFITGIGDKRVMNIHHRPSGSDGIAEPVPGLLSGGPDKNREDSAIQAAVPAGTPPALCFVDDQGSYSTNEICLNWNAPLVFVAGYFNNGSVTTDIKKEMGSVPSEIHLDQNYPNPFNPETIISYHLPKMSHVILKVYDVLGREVTTLLNEVKAAGSYELRFNVDSIEQKNKMTSGVYFVCLQANNFVDTKKMMLMK